jgi:hypothetical protein
MPMLMTSVIAPALPFEAAVADGRGKGGHPVERGQNGGHHVVAVDHHRAAVEVAKGGVQHRATFGFVDGHAREHRLALGRDLGRIEQVDQHRAGVGVDVGLGIVEQQVARLDREVCGPLGSAEIGDAAGGDGGEVILQGLEHGSSFLPNGWWPDAARPKPEPLRG